MQQTSSNTASDSELRLIPQVSVQNVIGIGIQPLKRCW